VTNNNGIFVALSDNTGIWPGSYAAAGIWAGVLIGSGDNPTGIPYTIGAHNFSPPYASSWAFVNPAGSGETDVSIGSTNTTIAPIACTPSMTIYSFGSSGGTFRLNSVRTDNSDSWSLGLPIMTCAVGPSTGAPQVCPVRSTQQVSAGTVMTLMVPAQTNSTGIFYVAFSCY
jgi:hypothetical protein